MYRPDHFNITDKDVIYDVMEEYSFATVFSQHNGAPCATHIPLTLDREEGVLHGHFARQNKQWEDIENQTSLAVFQGPHCYISPSWYETNKAVPTWNYVTVHVYGHIHIIDDEQELADAFSRMVLKYEAADSTYQLNEVDPAYIKDMSRGVTGFKMKITDIEGKAKLSQNHSPERQKRVVAELEKIPDDDCRKIARLMKRGITS